MGDEHFSPGGCQAARMSLELLEATFPSMWRKPRLQVTEEGRRADSWGEKGKGLTPKGAEASKAEKGSGSLEAPVPRRISII